MHEFYAMQILETTKYIYIYIYIYKPKNNGHKRKINEAQGPC